MDSSAREFLRRAECARQSSESKPSANASQSSMIYDEEHYLLLATSCSLGTNIFSDAQYHRCGSFTAQQYRNGDIGNIRGSLNIFCTDSNPADMDSFLMSSSLLAKFSINSSSNIGNITVFDDDDSVMAETEQVTANQRIPELEAVNLENRNSCGVETDFGACFLAHTRLAILYYKRSKGCHSGSSSSSGGGRSSSSSSSRQNIDNVNDDDDGNDNCSNKCDDNANNNGNCNDTNDEGISNSVYNYRLRNTVYDRSAFIDLQRAEAAATIAVRIYQKIFLNENLNMQFRINDRGVRFQISNKEETSEIHITKEVERNSNIVNDNNNENNNNSNNKNNNDKDYSYNTSNSDSHLKDDVSQIFNYDSDNILMKIPGCDNLKYLNEILEGMFPAKRSSVEYSAHVLPVKANTCAEYSTEDLLAGNILSNISHPGICIRMYSNDKSNNHDTNDDNNNGSSDNDNSNSNNNNNNHSDTSGTGLFSKEINKIKKEYIYTKKSLEDVRDEMRTSTLQDKNPNSVSFRNGNSKLNEVIKDDFNRENDRKNDDKNINNNNCKNNDENDRLRNFYDAKEEEIINLRLEGRKNCENIPKKIITDSFNFDVDVDVDYSLNRKEVYSCCDKSYDNDNDNNDDNNNDNDNNDDNNKNDNDNDNDKSNNISNSGWSRIEINEEEFKKRDRLMEKINKREGNKKDGNDKDRNEKEGYVKKGGKKEGNKKDRRNAKRLEMFGKLSTQNL